MSRPHWSAPYVAALILGCLGIYHGHQPRPQSLAALACQFAKDVVTNIDLVAETASTAKPRGDPKARVVVEDDISSADDGPEMLENRRMLATQQTTQLSTK